MNFLAHLYLSGPSEKILVGNFIADFVKGKQILDFENDIKQGILRHREIDRFTDQHPIVAQSKSRLRKKYRHYSGVIVDIFYDHFLAKNWKSYSNVTLNEFADHAFKVIYQYENILPEKVLRMLPFMVKNNWLVSYASLEGIDMALKGMAKRTGYVSHMETAVTDLKAFYNEFETEFKGFFPQIIAFVHQKSRL